MPEQRVGTLYFKLVETDEELDVLVTCASDIWYEYWPALIGEAQTDYMVEKFQSKQAIMRDMQEHHYRYWLLFEGDRLVGYTGGATELIDELPLDDAARRSKVVDRAHPRRFFISKIYLYAAERGKHFASRILEFYEALCREEGLTAQYLTVNRDNEMGVRAYLGRGFTIAEEQDNPIGNGFYMTDYIMVKEVDLQQ